MQAKIVDTTENALIWPMIYEAESRVKLLLHEASKN